MQHVLSVPIADLAAGHGEVPARVVAVLTHGAGQSGGGLKRVLAAVPLTA